MKQFAIILSIGLMLSSCGILGTQGTSAGNTSTVNTTAAYSTGQSFGSTIKTLFAQYQATGKLDLKNASTLMSLATLATNYQGLKSQLADKSFYTDFLTGLVSGTQSSVSENNASQLLNMFGNMDLNSLASLIGTKAGEAKISDSTAAEVNETMADIFALMK